MKFMHISMILLAMILLAHTAYEQRLPEAGGDYGPVTKLDRGVRICSGTGPNSGEFLWRLNDARRFEIRDMRRKSPAKCLIR